MNAESAGILPAESEPGDRARGPGWFLAVSGWLALAALAGLYVFRMFQAGFNPDEIEHVHSAWLVLQGQRPYLDFFQHHNPLLWYCLIPVVHFWEGDANALIAARLLQLLPIALYAAATYLLGRRLFGPETGLVAVLLLLSNVAAFITLIEVRPDVPQNALGMLSVLLLFWDRDGAKPRLAWLAGLSAGLAFVFLQKAIFLIAPLGLMLMLRTWRDRRHRSALGWFAAGIAVPLGAFAIWVCWFNDPAQYYFTNWTLNRSFQDRFSPVRFGAFQYQANAIPWMFAALSLFTFRHSAAARELMMLLVSCCCPCSWCNRLTCNTGCLPFP
jgi:4-amino-4-deoxy-L-arabinose transferase-like glycosyltransferase